MPSPAYPTPPPLLRRSQNRQYGWGGTYPGLLCEFSLTSWDTRTAYKIQDCPKLGHIVTLFIKCASHLLVRQVPTKNDNLLFANIHSRADSCSEHSLAVFGPRIRTQGLSFLCLPLSLGYTIMFTLAALSLIP